MSTSFTPAAAAVQGGGGPTPAAAEAPRPEAGVGEAAPPVRRMAVALLALGGLFVSTYLLLYHLGVVGTLVCGVSGGCHTVQASPWAVFAGIPVPALGVAGYALLLGVALAGLQPRLAGDRRIGLALLGLATVAFGFSVYLTALEAFVIGAWCRWCVVSAVLATLIFACSLAELPALRGSSPQREG